MWRTQFHKPSPNASSLWHWVAHIKSPLPLPTLGFPNEARTLASQPQLSHVPRLPHDLLQIKRCIGKKVTIFHLTTKNGDATQRTWECNIRHLMKFGFDRIQASKNGDWTWFNHSSIHQAIGLKYEDWEFTCLYNYQNGMCSSQSR